MRIIWKVSKKDIASVKAFYDAHKFGCFVQARLRTIKKASKSAVNKSQFWKAMVACLLTTQQRSGPNSPVGQFVAHKPFPLSYKVCVSHNHLEQHVLAILKAHGGIRRAPTIAKEVNDNFVAIEASLYTPMHKMLEYVRISRSAEAEKEGAAFIQDHFKGFGPKQSRNLLQTLGLSRYEIPIDSRITKWLSDFGFPIGLTATALSDRNYYQFVSDGFQQLCADCDIWPCLMDAAIFSSYDGDAWTEDNVYV